MGFEEKDGWSELLGQLVFFRSLAICEQTERPCFVFQNEEILRLRGVVSEKNLFSVDVPPNNHG